MVSKYEIYHGASDMHTLSWSAPISLHGVDTMYYVSVIDESEESKPIVKAVSDTSCDVELVACHSYSFSVVPWNEAGNGTELMLEYFYPGGMQQNIKLFW